MERLIAKRLLLNNAVRTETGRTNFTRTFCEFCGLPVPAELERPDTQGNWWVCPACVSSRGGA